jgi:uncharacterized protein YprB with RNaseH-like and TPR domain
MSSFGAKLERVRFGSSDRNGQATDQRRSEAISIEKKTSIAVSVDPLPLDPRARLDELRDRIAKILAKSPPARKRSDPTQGDLPFLREETKSGVLYVRRKHLSVAHRVGRAPVHVGRDASSEMLALLALDPSLVPADPARAVYLDTETTGLSAGAGTVPFLVGVAWFETAPSGNAPASLVVEQLLLRELGEEGPLLDRLAQRMAAASMLVTYNGKSFDVPLLATRLVMARRPPLAPRPHLDLVHVARRIHRHRLDQLTLRDVEAQVLGFERTADISGGEVCSRYNHFLRTGDESALTAVVDHNEWDIVAMAALVGLYGEPLAGLGPIDWPGVARTVRRAGSLELAGEIAERAVRGGGGSEAIRARGEIAKARGDKALALADYASLVETVDDPRLRLELAKLYEHHAKAPLAALEVVSRGTGERPDALARRRARLERKRDRKK